MIPPSNKSSKKVHIFTVFRQNDWEKKGKKTKKRGIEERERGEEQPKVTCNKIRI